MPLVDLVDERGVERGWGVDLEGRDGDPKIVRNGFDENLQAVSGVLFAHAGAPSRLSSPSASRPLAPDFARGLVLAQPDEDRMAKEPIVRPAQIGDLGDQLWPDPMRLGQLQAACRSGCREAEEPRAASS